MNTDRMLNASFFAVISGAAVSRKCWRRRMAGC
jgi:hypothetical protein